MSLLKGRTTFITGASAGIGKACAELFAKEKSNLILTARRIDKLKTLASRLEKDHKIKVKCLKLDVRDFDEVQNTISSLDTNWKKIDVLINNAGLSRGLNKIYEGKKEDWDEIAKSRSGNLLRFYLGMSW